MNKVLIFIIILTVFISDNCTTQKSYCEVRLTPDEKKEDCAIFYLMVYAASPNDRVVQSVFLNKCLSAMEAQKECDKKSEYLPNFND